MSTSFEATQAPEPDQGSGACFHCGLPIPDGLELKPQEVFGKPRSFCCSGCSAVCEAIVDSGLEDYYRFRTTDASGAAPAELVPEFLNRLAVYDRPEVQKGFVRDSANSKEASLLLEEIRCPACLWLNERHVRQQEGVLEVSTDVATQRMRVRWDPDVIQLSDILKAIAGIGYIAHPYDPAHTEKLNERRKRRSIERLIFSGILGMMVMNFSIASYVMGGPNEFGELALWEALGRWTSLFICFTLLAYPGQDFFIGAWRDLRNGQLGMDVPIVVGLLTAYLGSLHATITGVGEVYLDSIAMFIFFVLMARYFETRGRVRSAAFLDRLAQAVPAMTRRINEDGEAVRVPVLDLHPGDVVLVSPGEQVPVDGRVIEGASSFDESLLTGESMPVHHGPGDEVVAGSVNGEQAVRVEVLNREGGTTIDQINRLINRGLENRPRSALLAENAARWFVSIILLIALVTAGYWYMTAPEYWLPNTVAVLIVTCPCALALATPVSLAIGAGRFIDEGILPLRMSAIDVLARAKTIVFDKTGTLTTGQFSTAIVVTDGELEEQQVKAYAAAIAASSEHPVAKAVARISPGAVAHIDVNEIHNTPGQGIEATIDGKLWRFGRPDYVCQLPGIGIPDSVADHEARGYTVSLLADSSGVHGLFALEDGLRKEATSLVAGLRAEGVEDMAILSGDAEQAVSKAGRELGINDAQGRMTPSGKLSWMQNKQAVSGPVIMVGDGINDAPTLAAADVSISLASSTDLANASSDMLLVKDDLGGALKAVKLSRRIYANIKQNLGWAVTYNFSAVPLAAAGYIPPWAAAIGMSASSIIVVVNALRLQKKI